ncbi:MAG: hypothetical protein K2Q09_02140, partial [Phycisphaerales bacterium]|nr:hypothetical protein [Phycisphaerales bacterium]
MPTNDELAGALARVLGAILDQRPDLRESVAVIARWISEVAAAPAGVVGTKNITDQAGEAAAGEPLGDVPASSVRPGSEPATADRALPPPLPEAYVPLKIGDSVVQVKVAGTSLDIGRARVAAFEASLPPVEDRTAYADLDEPDLEIVIKRCELKVRACEAAKALQHAPHDQQFVVRGTIIHDLVPAAKDLPNCFLWMTMPDKPYPGDHAIDLCRDAYANAAAAARLLMQTAGQHRPTAVQHALDLAAEAQSALRAALKSAWLTRDDFDQYDLFIWVRRFAERNRYYIDRHLRVDDPADPTDGGSLAARIQDALEAARHVSDQTGRVKTSLSKARYHAKQIADNPTETRQTDWAKAMEALAAARSAGAQAGDSRVREVANLLGRL